MVALVAFVTILIYAILVIIINAFIPYVNTMLADLNTVAFDLSSKVPLLESLEAGLSNLFFSIGISLIVLFFAKKGFETYISWTDGDADSDPIYLLSLFFKAIGTACCFNALFDYFAEIIKEITVKINGITGTVAATSFKLIDDLEMEFNPVSLMLLLIWIIMFLVSYFSLVKMGLEIILLKIGFPLACSGLINADKGIFKAYLMTLTKSMVTVMVQIGLMSMSASLAQNWDVYVAGEGVLEQTGSLLLTQLASITCMSLAIGTPKLLSEFLIPSGQGLNMSSVYHAGKMAGSVVHAVKSVATK